MHIFPYIYLPLQHYAYVSLYISPSTALCICFPMYISLYSTMPIFPHIYLPLQHYAYISPYISPSTALCIYFPIHTYISLYSTMYIFPYTYIYLPLQHYVYISYLIQFMYLYHTGSVWHFYAFFYCLKKEGKMLVQKGVQVVYSGCFIRICQRKGNCHLWVKGRPIN